jgi:O-antigen/teichoic acid export membrane protein
MNAKPSLKRNTLANFIGGVLPMIVSLVTVPMYLHHIGAARYGVLAIVWMLQGYFGYFDLGLASATANRIAQLGESTAAERESVLWTAFALNMGIGISGGLLLFALGHVLFAQFHLVPELNAEVLTALPWIACTVPLAMLSGVFSGALIGREQFARLNAVQFVSVLIFQVVPLLAAIIFAPNLQTVICAATLGSTASVLLKIAVVFRAFPLRFAGGPSQRWIKPLFSYGVWITISNILGPILDSVDRLLIGSVLGPQSVAYYQVPSNLAVRVRVLPGAICGSLSPRLASLDRQSAMALANRALRGLSAALTPMIVFGIFLMHPFLTLWVGHDFALKAAPIGTVILVGVWFNCLAHVPYCHVQAIGRPNVGAYNHAAEVIPYIACIWLALHSLGLIGAAYVWSARAAVDFALGFWAAGYRAGLARHLTGQGAVVVSAYGLMLLFPWQSYAYCATWGICTCAAIIVVLHNDPVLRTRVAGSISTLLRSGWRRS